MLSTVEETRGYDFDDPENEEKWRGIFVNALGKVLEQVHPTLHAEETALEYVESLCLRLLGTLCAVPSPLTVQDIEERVTRTFPTPMHKWALSEARETSLRKKKSLLPYDKVHQLLQKEVLMYKIDISVSVYMTAVVEYVAVDILKLAGNFVKKIPQKSAYEVITYRDIKTAMCADKVLLDMFYQESEPVVVVEEDDTSIGRGGRSGRSGRQEKTGGSEEDQNGRRGSISYAELVRDLVTDEKHFLRDLNLIIRVFKEELERILGRDSRAIYLIFGNIVDIYELTVTLLGNLEDAIEMSQDSPTPYIGSCFEELAEVEEFRAYVRYMNIVTRKESRDVLQSIVDDPVYSGPLESAGHGFRLAVKYYLPKLVLAPIAHVFLYHKYILALLQIAPAFEDRESFKQVECNLHPIKKLLSKGLGNGPKIDPAQRMASRARRQLAIDKCNELARILDNWDNRDIGQCCNEFIREDTLSKIGPGKKIAERRAYLFDGLLLLCKPITSVVGVNSSSSGSSCSGVQQFKLKEKLHIRKLELVDRIDTEEGRYILELCPRVGPPVLLSCSSCAEKRNWMCDLVMLSTKPMLDRFLDSILLELERRHPLQLPAVSQYRFAEPDGPHNIMLEEHNNHSHHGSSAAAPLIKGATLLKLVERLTYHIYADLNLVRTFLTTYRSFCTPMELLQLLVERFHIPEPSEVYDTPRTESIENIASSDAEKLSKNSPREDWKRYRKVFQQPVKFRVINVLRHWVDQHYYDFEREPELLDKLREFLESVDGKPMRKWVQSVLKTVQRKSGQLPPSGPEDAQAEENVQSGQDTQDGQNAQSGQNVQNGQIAQLVQSGQNVTSRQNVQSWVNAQSSLNAESESSAAGSVAGTVAGITTVNAAGNSVPHVFDRLPPAPHKHIADPERFGWHPLTLHPVELARQLTIIEFHLYRLVKPSELVGAVWTKKNKEETSPHLLRIIKHTTNFTRWMEKWIIESENIEERVAVLCRLLEVAIALRALNNFNGVLAVVAACGSASVHRLRNTFQLVPLRLLRALEEFRSLSADHFRIYHERLRSVNPPCVPFFGIYLTNILHIEEGNLDFLPDTKLINFSKYRKVAGITGEIQQYQNQPYCLTIEPATKAFLETLDPFPGRDDNEITNYLYAKSLEIEPRPPLKQTPKFPRRYPELSLKSVKVSRRHHHDTSDDSTSISQLSPTSSVWDGGSVNSLSMDDQKGSKQEAVSPRLERCSLSQLSQLSLFDKGLALFDKNKPSNNNKSCAKDEPPSPRDRHSPRHDRQGSVGERLPALSPRNAIVDAELFYSRTAEHVSSNTKKQDKPEPPAEWVPPLLPRSSVCGSAAGGYRFDPEPPLVPPRPTSPTHNSHSPWSPPPSPAERPQPSPRHNDISRMPAISPKRSPAPQPPSASPLVHGDRSGGVAFRFPCGPPLPPPLTPHPPQPPPPPHPPHPPLPCRVALSSSPPPLPPRRRRDPPPLTPLQLSSLGASPVYGSVAGGSGGGSGSPPPLPPRPAPPPELLRPAHSTILQRRHHTNSSGAPRLPPKPVTSLTHT